MKILNVMEPAFKAYGKVVKTVIKEPMQQAHLEVKVSAHNLTEGRTDDKSIVYSLF